MIVPLLAQGETTRLIIAVVASTGIGAIVVELIRSRSQRPQMDANTAKVLTEAATTLLQPLQERVVELTGEVAIFKQRAEEAEAECESMRADFKSKMATADTEIEHLRSRVRQYEAELDRQHPPD